MVCNCHGGETCCMRGGPMFPWMPMGPMFNYSIRNKEPAHIVQARAEARKEAANTNLELLELKERVAEQEKQLDHLAKIAFSLNDRLRLLDDRDDPVWSNLPSDYTPGPWGWTSDPE